MGQSPGDSQRRERDPDAVREGSGTVTPLRPRRAAPAEVPAPFGAERRDNLPAQLTSFVGREREAAEVARLLEANRLVTLVGAPGVGKTRLALRVVEEVKGRFPDGVWLVELAPLADPRSALVPALVSQAIAAALGVRESRGRRLRAALLDALGHGHLLLVLDNCEHLVAACAELAVEILRACPNVRILATSRELLAVAGEATSWVPSLSLPDADRLPGPERLMDYEAIRLFVDRATLAKAGFAITDRNAAAVAQVCRRLDGIPLAIELAAARARALSIAQIAERLDDCFSLLTGGSRAALPQHRTLKALVDWSHDHLSDDERILLRRLSVFAGGWTLEAAEQVVSGQRPAVSDEGGRATGHWPLTTDHSPLDVLAGLVEKSLVLVDERHGMVRFHLLETIRQYAADRLREAAEEQALRDRHRDWFLAFAERASGELFGPRQREWLDTFELDHGNLRAALRWCVERPDREGGLRFGWAMWRFWEGRNHLAEGRAWLDEFLGVGPASAASASECRASYAAGRMAFLQGDGEAARRFLEPCLARSRELGEAGLVASALKQLGHLNRDRGNLAEARSQYELGYQICREQGDAWGMASSQLALGRLAMLEGALDDGRALVEESLRSYRAVGDPTDIARVLLLLGGVACDLGHFDEARAHFHEGLETAANLGDLGRVAANLEGCALLAAAEGRPERAARLAAMAAAMSATTGTVLAADEQRRAEAGLGPIRASLGDSVWSQLLEQARRTTVDEALTYALDREDGAPVGEARAPAPAAEWRGTAATSPVARLSPREREVLRLVAAGRTDRQIADALVMSARTAEWYVAKLRARLDLDTRGQLGVWATRNGLGPDPQA